MKINQLSPFLSVSPQIGVQDVGILAAQGFRAIVSNRPDDEADDQPPTHDIATAAERHGMVFRHIPVVSGKIIDDDIVSFADAMASLPGPVLAFCRTGTRSASLWALSEARHLTSEALLRATEQAGYDLSGLKGRLDTLSETEAIFAPARDDAVFGRTETHDVVLVGGGSAGIATAASLLKRRPGLDIVVIEPRDQHYYQPGWTLVGGGVFERSDTERPMSEVMPKGVRWVRAAVAAFEPEANQVVLEDGARLKYRTLVAAPGIKLDWDRIEGLRETLGRNGVTSNYRFEMAPYTWELIQTLRDGTALFTQPPMPIKCAGAPQKAMYLACDYWRRHGRLDDIDVHFLNAGPVLFGVEDYVPALMTYVERYGIDLDFKENLVAVDGAAKVATFEVTTADGTTKPVRRAFDMIHVCPPQSAPDFVRDSPLAGDGGWIDVSPETLQHSRFGNIFGLGDACSAPNAKTAAAVRKQAPVVAVNVLKVLDGKSPRAVYDGYGSCPLTVERGKIVLAEFGYGGKLLPTFPSWLVNGRKPTRLAWLLKEKLLPDIYWDLMLKGREWLAGPILLPHEPAEHAAQEACDTDGRRKVS